MVEEGLKLLAKVIAEEYKTLTAARWAALDAARALDLSGIDLVPVTAADFEPRGRVVSTASWVPAEAGREN